MTVTDRQTMRWGDQHAGGPPDGRGARGGPADERPDWQERLALRNWSLPVKLAAVLLVPTLFVISLGVTRIVEQTQQAQSFDGVQQAVALEEDTSALLADLASERTASAVFVAAGRTGDPVGVQAAAEASEVSADRLRDAVNGADSIDAQSRTAFADAAGGLEQLDGLRADVREGEIDAAGVLGRYSEEINALLVFSRALASEAADPSVAGLSSGLYSLALVREQDAYIQAVIASGIGAGRIDAPSIDQARNATLRRTIAVDDFRAAIGTENPQLADAVVGPDVDERDLLAQVVLGRGSAGLPLQVEAPEWDRVSNAVFERDAAASQQLRTGLQADAQALQDGARNAAGIASVLLLLALIAGAAVVFFVTRSLLRPLRLLRRTALDVAERRLPGAVRSLREGETPDTDVAATPIRTREEIGQVARAFDQVHEQAVRLAAEQAGLRSAFNSIFINLSRRSQALVERQLQLIEQLENKEEDPEALSSLFQLDHLATRMRRNSENLLVLSGTDLARRGSRPVPVVDVLRAAASEVEQYQRVDIAPPPNVMLLGRTASDIVHLVAELLENATAFSAPDTRVDVVVAQVPGGGLSIDIVDAGVGMTENDMRDANARLAAPPTIDVSASRRMGLFVVGRLATRHGIAVSLRSREPVGVVARVLVPANAILASAPGRSRPGERATGATGALPVEAPASTGSALPAGVPTNGRPAPSPRPTETAATSFFDPGTGAPPAGSEGLGSVNGIGPHGSGVNGSAPSSSGVNGSGLNGSGLKGSGLNGSGRNGSGQNGTGQNGTGLKGSGLNGSGRNGSGSNGSGESTSSGSGQPGRSRRPGVLGGLPTRNSRRMPPPGHADRVTSDDAAEGADVQPTSTDAAAEPLPTRTPGEHRGSLAPVEEVPPPGTGDAGAADADAHAAPAAGGPATAAWSVTDVEDDDEEADDADERVASVPSAESGDGVTVWRAPGAPAPEAPANPEVPANPEAPETAADTRIEEPTGRHQWRRPPPEGAQAVPSGGAPQHGMTPQGFQGAPGPRGPQPLPGRPGPHGPVPYPPPPGWAPPGQPRHPGAGPPQGRPGPVPPGRGPGPRPPWAPPEDQPREGESQDGRPQQGEPRNGESPVVERRDAPEATAAAAVAPAVEASPAADAAPPAEAGSAAPPAEAGSAAPPAEAGSAAPPAAPASEAPATRAPRRALPMTVRRSGTPQPGEEAQAAQTQAPQTQAPQARAPQARAPQVQAPAETGDRPEAGPEPEAGEAASTSSAAGAAGPAAEPEGDAPDQTSRPLARRRGPSGGPGPGALPGGAARLRTRRTGPRSPETSGSSEVSESAESAESSEAPENVRGGGRVGETGEALFSAPAAESASNGAPAPVEAPPAGNGARATSSGAPARPLPARPSTSRLPQRPAKMGRERTPIFDEVASVWFRESSPDDGAADDWQTSGDAGWRAAAASTEVADAGTTTSGLPRRRPRARLMPGTAGQDAPAASSGPTNGSTNGSSSGSANGSGGGEPSATSDPGQGTAAPMLSRRRSPDAVRGRLASYQRGVNEGRGGRGRQPQNGDGDRPGDEEEQ